MFQMAHQVFYGDLFYTLRNAKDVAIFISSGSKKGIRFQRRQNREDKMYFAQPYYSLVQIRPRALRSDEHYGGEDYITGQTSSQAT